MELIPLLTAENKMAKANAEALLKEYGVPFTKAGELMEAGQKIVVTDENDAQGMAKARELRLELRQERIAIEKRHAELKADVNVRGNAIDLVKRTAVEQIKPIEEHLALQEKFAEVKQAERKAKVTTERIQKLTAFNTDITMYNVEDMTDEQFETLVSNLQAQADAKVAEEKRLADEAEAQRVADEKAREEQAAENARLKKEADDRAEADRKSALAQQEEAKRITDVKVDLLSFAHGLQTIDDCEKAQANLEKYHSLLTDEDQKNEAIDGAFNKSSADITSMKNFIRERAVEQAETDRIAKEAEDKRLQDEADRKAMLAPDKEKLLQFATAMEQVRTEKLPAMKSKQGQDVVNEIENIFTRLNVFITKKANEL